MIVSARRVIPPSTSLQQIAKQSKPIFSLERDKTLPNLTDHVAPQFIAESIDAQTISRLYLMAYIPAGFWSRLMTRILGDDQLPAYFGMLLK